MQWQTSEYSMHAAKHMTSSKRHDYHDGLLHDDTLNGDPGHLESDVALGYACEAVSDS